mgnify:CR=1 FL=1
MSCPVESDLNRHLEQLDIQAREEKYAEENPSYYYLVKAYNPESIEVLESGAFLTGLEWEEYAYSKEEKDAHIATAKKTGLFYTCKKEIVELNY